MTDQDDGSAPAYQLPSPTTAGALPPAAPSTSAAGTATGAPASDDEARWVERTGWAPRFGSTDNEEGESLLEHSTWLEGKLDDKFFGGRYIDRDCPPRFLCFLFPSMPLEASTD